MIETRIGYKFKNPKLLDQALTHKSFQSEDQNERLEFLGDAVIDLVLAELLMEKFADQDEGRLSKKRAGLVNESSLASIATELDLGAELKLGKSEIQSNGSKKPRILAGSLEALVGAMYLDSGFETTRKVVTGFFLERLDTPEAEHDFILDFKTRLQELIQESQKAPPTYTVLSETLEANVRTFSVQVEINGTVLGTGQSSSKKAAEQEAAKSAIEGLEKSL